MAQMSRQRKRKRERDRETGRRREARKGHRGIHGRWDATRWDEMIVLHVARARTDSINIRGSLGKTRAALWITDATFLYFSGCNAHTPFTLFPFRPLSLSFIFFYLFISLSRLTLVLPLVAFCFPSTVFSYLSSRVSLSHSRVLVFSSVHISHLFSPLPLLYSRPISTHDSLPFSGTDEDSSLSATTVSSF